MACISGRWRREGIEGRSRGLRLNSCKISSIKRGSLSCRGIAILYLNLEKKKEKKKEKGKEKGKEKRKRKKKREKKRKEKRKKREEGRGGEG